MAVTVTTPTSEAIHVKTETVARTDTTAKDLFGIPKDSKILYFTVSGETASDSATSAVLNVGISTDDNKYISALNLKQTHPFVSINGIAINTNVSADTIIEGKYTEVGAASTGGPWTVSVYYTR